MSPRFFISTCWLGLVAAWVVPPNALEDAELHFEHFIHHHGKEYVDKYEKQARFQIFKENLANVIERNEKNQYATYGITKFMDLNEEDFIDMYPSLKGSIDYDKVPCPVLFDKDIPHLDAPESFDWRDRDVVTQVLDKKRCVGWAFSAAGNIESQLAIKHKKKMELSKQQLFDCDKSTAGCYGGLAASGFRTIIELGGIESEVDYRYNPPHSYCKFEKDRVRVKLTHCHMYDLTSQEKVKGILFKNGPISIVIAASSVYRYERGILTDDHCTTSPVNLDGLIVGYGKDEEKNMPYWIIKNFWGKSWGEDGYFRIQRGENATSCGMMNIYMSMAFIE